MPSITHQRNNQKRKNKMDALKGRQKRIQSMKHTMDPNNQGSMSAVNHLAGLKDEGLVGRLIMELFMLCFEFTFNTPYWEAKNEYNAKLKEFIDEYSDHDLAYIERSPANENEWAEMLGQIDGEADAAYILTGNNELYYVDMNKGTRNLVTNDAAVINALKQQLNITDASIATQVANARLGKNADQIENLDKAIRARQALPNDAAHHALRAEIPALEAQKRALMTQAGQSNVGLFLKGLNKHDLDAISQGTGHQRRRFCMAYCKQAMDGTPDPDNGEFPPIYPLGADYKPDYSQDPMAEEDINETHIRANGFVPIPTLSEGLKIACDRHWERQMGTPSMWPEQMLRCYGVAEMHGNAKGAKDDLADDRTAQMLAARQAQAVRNTPH